MIGCDGYGKIFKLKIFNSGIDISELTNAYEGFSNFSFDPTGNSCVAEKKGELYFIDLRNKADGVEILSGYTNIVKKNVNFDRTSVMFMEDGKYYVALYHKAERIFKIHFDMGADPIKPSIYSNDMDEIIYVERGRKLEEYEYKNQASDEVRSKIIKISKNGYSESNFKTDVKFHHPYLFFLFDNNEVWVQKIDDPKTIHRFIFFNSISSINQIDDVFHEGTKEHTPCSFSCLLTYAKVHRLANFEFRMYPKLDPKSKKPKSPDDIVNGIGNKPIMTFVMNRMIKNIPISSLPLDNIISIAVLNTPNSADYYIMLHYLNRLEFYDSRVDSIVSKLHMILGKRNIIKFDIPEDENSKDTGIFLWRDNGRFIEILERPVGDGKPMFNTFKAYNSVGKIKMCKKIKEPSKSKQALLVCDTYREVKLLIYDEVDKNLTVDKIFFVEESFGYTMDLDYLESLCASESLLYSNDETYMMQPRNSQGGSILINEDYKKLSTRSTAFPLCSQDYVLRQLQDDPKNKSGCNLLYLSQPLDSYQAKHSIKIDTNIEFLLPGTEKRFIRIYQDVVKNVVYIQLFSFKKQKAMDLFKWDLVKATVVQNDAIEMRVSEVGGHKTPSSKFEVLVSRNGEHVCVVSESRQEIRHQIFTFVDGEGIGLGRIDSLAKDFEAVRNKNKMNKIQHKLSGTVKYKFERMMHSSKDKNKCFMPSKHKWCITNDMKVVGVDLYKESIIIDGVERFNEVVTHVNKSLKNSIFDFKVYETNFSELLDRTLIGEDYIVTWTDNYGILSFKFDYVDSKVQGEAKCLKFSEFKKLGVSPIVDYENINLSSIAPTSHKDFFLVFYKFDDTENIVIWDIKKNMEYDNFTTRNNDKFMFYCNGLQRPDNPESLVPAKKEPVKENPDKKDGKKSKKCKKDKKTEESHSEYNFSEMGYLMFNNYYVNIDNMVPSPFIQAKHNDLNISYWNMGRRMGLSENCVIIKGNILTSYSYLDIYLRSTLVAKAPNSIQECKYFINRNSVITDHDTDYEQLKVILEMLKQDPIYLTAIVLPDMKGESPMMKAINKNAPKTVELYLKYLVELPDFKLSKSFSHKFDNLFEMGIIGFKDYLDSCYFQTGQMKMLTRVYDYDIDRAVMSSSNSSVLTGKFLKHLMKNPNASQEGNNDKVQVEKKEFSFDESSTPGSDVDIDENESVHSVRKIDYKTVEQKEIEKNDGQIQTVNVYAIEFDWILKSAIGESFLQQLADTDDLSYFDLDIVKQVIYYQWSRYLKRITLFLFIPFLAFFLAFILFATWVIHEMHIEDDSDGKWRAAAFIFAIILIVFQTFFVAVEINQILKNWKGYLTSFWNIVDISSIVFNYTLLIMVLSENQNNNVENAFAGFAVFLLWVRLFYLLRVFESTAYLVSMITAIIIDMKYFMLALLVAILAFGNAYFILGRNSEEDNFTGNNIWEAFIYAVRTGLGDFNVDGFGTSDELLIWIIFFINTIIVVIIVLNLVIAIMGDTFGKVQETQEATKLQEFASIIRENEFLISRTRLFKHCKYIIVIAPNKSEDQDDGDWQGRLIELKKKLTLSIKKNQDEFGLYNKKVMKTIDSNVKEKLKPSEDRLMQNIEMIEAKLTKYMKSTEKNNPEVVLNRIRALNRGF